MHPSFLHILLSDEAARAVCWTLVHSLWQGIIAALLAAAIIFGTRKRSAALRYNLLTVVIALFLLTTVITFLYQFNPPQPQRIALSETNSPITIDNTPSLITNPTELPPTILRQTNNYLNTHASLITGIWLACLFAQVLRLSGGLLQIRRLRRHSSEPPGEYWRERLVTLSRQLGVKRTVTLLQSQLAKAPVAFGFLKPSILVPIGFLTQLPPHQVETILLHELAHIRRNDFLANLLLHVIEAIFFFNPGVRWIAALIRREREACCDDMVLADTPDANNYFEALLAYTQLALGNGTTAPAYVLQLGGNRNTDLFWRIKRMLEQENKKLHAIEKTILSLGLIAIIFFSLLKPTAQAATIKLPQTTNNSGVSKPSIANTPAAETTAPPENTEPVAGSTPSIEPSTPTVAPVVVPPPPAPVPPAPATTVADTTPATPAHEPTPPTEPRNLFQPIRPLTSLQTPIKPLHPIAPQKENPPTFAYPLVYAPQPNPWIICIAKDLVKTHLLPQVEKYEFHLDAHILIVNGIRQPDNIYQQFKEKYIHDQNDRFEYSQYYTDKGSGSHCEVHTPNTQWDLTNVY